MTLDKAIKILQSGSLAHVTISKDDIEQAQRLGAEALLRIKRARLHPLMVGRDPLFGETEE